MRPGTRLLYGEPPFPGPPLKPTVAQPLKWPTFMPPDWPNFAPPLTSLSVTHALNMARTAYPIIKFHRMHFPDHCLLFQA